MFLCYPSALGSVRPGAYAGDPQRSELGFWQVRAASKCRTGRSPVAGLRAKSRGALVCRCTSSHDQEDGHTLFQRLAGRAYRSGTVGKLFPLRQHQSEVKAKANCTASHGCSEHIQVLH